MQAHALTPRLCAALEQYASPKEQNAGPQPAFPFLTLLISGGHTLLLHSTGIANHRILANTDDIAIGDCLDKCARSILPQALLDSSTDVSYGRLLESFAFPIPGPHAYDETALSRGRGSRASQSPYGWQLPVPLLATRGGQKSKSMQFSYTGLVTSATRVAENGWVDGRLGKEPRKVPMPEQEARCLAREVMRIAFEHLASRVALQTEREHMAHEIMPTTPISNTLVVSGGVAANQYLRHVFKSQPSLSHLNVIIPPIHLCTDNAAMIAWAAHEMFPILHPRMDKGLGKHHLWNPTQGQLEMDVLRKWSLENILHPEKESNARETIGDAATVIGTKPCASPEGGDTNLVKQESNESAESVHEPLLGNIPTPIFSKMENAISASFGSLNESPLQSSDEVVSFLQQMQDDQSSRRTTDSLHRLSLDRSTPKPEKVLDSQLEPSTRMDDIHEELRPDPLDVIHDYRGFWERYTLPDDGKEVDDDLLQRRSSLVARYRSVDHRSDSGPTTPAKLLVLTQPELVRALNTDTLKRWLSALVRVTHPTLIIRRRVHMKRFSNVIDRLELASWVLHLERDLTVQKEAEGPVMGPTLNTECDEDCIVKDVWLGALHCLESTNLSRLRGLKLLEKRKVYDLEDVKTKVINWLRKEGWNVDGTRIDTMDSGVPPIPNALSTDLVALTGKLHSGIGERRQRPSSSVTDQFRAPCETRPLSVLLSEIGEWNRQHPSSENERHTKFKRLLASASSSQRDDGYGHFKPSIEDSFRRGVQHRRQWLSFMPSKRAGEAEDQYAANEPVSHDFTVYENKSQMETKDSEVGWAWSRRYLHPARKGARRTPKKLGDYEGVTDGGWSISGMF